MLSVLKVRLRFSQQNPSRSLRFAEVPKGLIMKATHASEVKRFTDIPNIGPAAAKDFVLLGIKSPAELSKHDAFALYTQLCKITKTRQDPCVLDTLMAAIDFMQGASARPWWHYTAQRKHRYKDL
jgi:Pathogenicity locus